MSEPAQGWYPDPSGTPHLRWWNGHSWTNYVMPYAIQNQSVSKPRLPAHNEAVAPRGGQRLGARTAAAPALRAEASAPRDTKAHPPLTAKRGATPSPTTETDSAPSPRPPQTAEAPPASAIGSTSATTTQDAPKKHTTAHWALACAWSSLSSASSCSRGPTWATPTRSTRMPRRKHGTHKRNATGLNPRSTTSTARSRRPSSEHRPPLPCAPQPSQAPSWPSSSSPCPPPSAESTCGAHTRQRSSHPRPNRPSPIRRPSTGPSKTPKRALIP